MKIKEEFAAACRALRKNDPSLIELNLAEYDSLLDRKRIQQVVQALEKNVFVENLTLSENLCVHSTLQLSHFLKTSPSLRHLQMCGKAQCTEGDEEKAIIKASIVFESISRSSVLVKLGLFDIVLGDDCPLEDFLSSTLTLLELTYFQNYSTMTHQVAQAIGSGLAKNKSLVKLTWNVNEGVNFLEEVLFGLCDHISLKTLELGAQLTETSSLALRYLMHFNGKLESLDLSQLVDHENTPTMVSVLAGIARNTGLKKVSFGTISGEINSTLATAWTNMLERNASIIILDLRNVQCPQDTECVLSSAVAEGLVTNSNLETLYIPGWSFSNPDVFPGPAWQEMLESNHCLQKLGFSNHSISVEAFQCLARGLSHNSSLESLDLHDTEMMDTDVIALVEGLRTNKTLKYLFLSCNRRLSQSGRAAIEWLMGYNVLRVLNLANTPDSVGVSILASGLSDNHSLEELDLDRTFVNGEGSDTFRALCGSLRGNTTLRHLNVSDNGVHLDGVCVTALIDTMALETLALNDSAATSCGITALAQSLQGSCTLKRLSLRGCDLDDTGLLKLGEALTTNVSLEMLDVRGNNGFTLNGACQFFGLLPQMKGLKKVFGLMIIGDDSAPNEAVGVALFDGLGKNTKLQKIFADNEKATVHSNVPSGVARKIDFYLSLNRHGRMLLRPPEGSEAPSGLWPRVLAKIAGPHDMSLLFYFLQNKPKIVNWNAPAIPKREGSIEVIVPC
jgi:Ran GTPase-activating protein (RanGAP) involved in mRNA processing and transport